MKPEEQAAVRDLPICQVLDDIRATLQKNHALIVEAPPGAGKTTLIPLALMDEPWLAGQTIIMLQPRRIAARNAAERMAKLLGESCGERVGYRMRLETRVRKDTRIEVVTEGVLLRMLADDPSLDGVGLVIFDEFHERSLDGDLGLALTRHARKTFEREDSLKLLVMSATLDQEQLSAYLQCPVMRSEGRVFPVAIHYRAPRGQRPRIVDEALRVVDEALGKHPDSSILVFLPGQGEIHQVQKALTAPPGVSVHPLLGSLSLEEQRAAIAPVTGGRRKLVLATNVAETSLTIEGVDVVVDSGLERRPVFDPNTGMSRLHTVKISQASAEQRRGRAGRLRAGTCYRLWPEGQQSRLAPQLAPEIDEADLAPLVLRLFDWGIYDPSELHWVSAPPEGAYTQALDLLQGLGAIDEHADADRLTGHRLTGYRLTGRGSLMAQVATHPRLAHMLVAGAAVGARHRAALLAAVLSDRDPVSRETPDMSVRIEYLEDQGRCPPSLRAWCQRTQRLARQLGEQLPASVPATLNRPKPEQLTGYLLACAYPERVARRRHSSGFQLANGRSAQFAEPHALGKRRWLSVAEVGGLAGRKGDVIRSADALDPELFEGPLESLVREDTQIDWDEKSGRFVAEVRRCIGALVLSRRTLEPVPADLRLHKLLERIGESQLRLLPWTDEARCYLARARCLGEFDDQWPAFTEQALMESLEDWLGPFIGSVARLSELKKINLLDALKSRLSWDQQQTLERQLPSRIEVPSGSRILIDYEASPPVLAVKLQEMFGATDTPTVAGGRLPLMIHLLSPAGRPLQVTQDLGGFWDSSYAEVRKEMRGRYPKHPWPEDPRTAPPTRHTKGRWRN